MRRLINQQPSRVWGIALSLLPFALLLLIYVLASDARLAENPQDKLLPSFEQMGDAIHRLAFEPSKRTGEYLFWQDTLSSLTRLGLGMLIAASLGMLFGLGTGAFPLAYSGVAPLLTVVSLIPPMAILPILFIVFGLGEVSKVALIAIGVTPFIARDIQKRCLEIPREQLVKAQTLGANSGQILLRVLIPQLMPRLIDAVRLSLGSAWLFLIAAEAIASTDGLGYRVFLVRRYLSMDVILPYVAWIALLAFVIDLVLRKLSLWAYPWQESRS
ncbi:MULTISPECIES: ABC transporter permease [Spongiibacter]|mgnify:FL=1|jgi:NitT/TauT family transport system permease protein|uniref:ABC transporter permease n=1 Tax=Spongiibacter TaxID=630749 RepID=UPI0003B7A5FC|nr:MULTISPECIES: ABC transporter permease subunit [Spongiibacter]MAY40041.1 lipid kinase [Spongiibacter sp.]MBI58823.1 lipid kinase [Spongiibacter sp.]MBO6751983.1 ABC transporter permease subunit [Spongiibacter sp.]|tara:strand:+ start:6699 stop:7514 length:816 start_codon:yes stop_codon:yes gene_type:complete